ncbi:MAG: hypothetical protein V7607_5782 [Solirubrobacteraceae bacterium]
MFHTHSKALATGLATALSLAAMAPAALAQPTDLRSPDTRDAAEPAHVVVAGPPTWPVTQQAITRPRAAAHGSSSGLDWGSAGIGAAAGLGACGIALAGVGGLRRRVARPAGEL